MRKDDGHMTDSKPTIAVTDEDLAAAHEILAPFVKAGTVSEHDLGLGVHVVGAIIAERVQAALAHRDSAIAHRDEHNREMERIIVARNNELDQLRGQLLVLQEVFKALEIVTGQYEEAANLVSLQHHADGTTEEAAFMNMGVVCNELVKARLHARDALISTEPTVNTIKEKIRADERERCAVVAENQNTMGAAYSDDELTLERLRARQKVEQIAAAIRALANSEGESDFSNLPKPEPGQADAARDVLAERQRQKDVEGWTEEHDDSHDAGELAGAGAAYALNAACLLHPYDGTEIENPELVGWMWDRKWWKPKSPRRDLVRSAALILAEIERIDRELDKAIEHVREDTPS